jgi:threonine dehydratase
MISQADLTIPEVTRADVVGAAARIAGQVVRTPLIEAQLPVGRVWLKAECLQTGCAGRPTGCSN